MPRNNAVGLKNIGEKNVPVVGKNILRYVYQVTPNADGSVQSSKLVYVLEDGAKPNGIDLEVSDITLYEKD